MTKYNLKIKKGTDFVFDFRFRKTEDNSLVPLTGTSGTMNIDVDDVKYPGVVTIDDTLNVVRCKVARSITATIPVGVGRYDIDLEMPNGDVLNIFSGDVEILENVNV